MSRVNLYTQHRRVLSLERSLSISAVGYLHSSGSVLADGYVKGCTVCTHAFVRIKLYARRQALNRPLFQRATNSIVVLDAAWPSASETYGLCCLCAYFCAHKLVGARSCVVNPQIAIAMGLLQLQTQMSWLRALSRGCRCCGPGCWCWCCDLAEHAFETAAALVGCW